MDCVFCQRENNEVLASNISAYAIYDRFPVTELHVLIIPVRHVGSYFDLSKAEHEACHALVFDQQKRLTELDPTISGFNVGMNVGRDAGQTVMHCHLHLIPRRKGDTADPRGGVRGVIPEKQQY